MSLAAVPFILASGSPRRKAYIKSLGINFISLSPDINEIDLPYESPQDCVRRLSSMKAHNIALDLEDDAYVILAADTVVSLPNIETGISTILGKPNSKIHAIDMLRKLRETPHSVSTGITLLVSGRTPMQINTAVTTLVVMRKYSDAEIEKYVQSGEPFDKAGGYAIQDKEFHPVDHIVGSYSNVVGLPMETLRKLLDLIGYPYNKESISDFF